MTSSNPFENGSRKIIPAVLIYGRCDFEDGEKILMIHRSTGTTSSGAPDYHAGKWNGLGGKLEADESPLEGALREFREESGVALTESALHPVGTLQFPNFKAHKHEDWFCFVFTARLTREQASSIRPDCPEGRLHWIPRGDLLSLNLWPGDRHFLPRVLAETPFFGTIWYDGPEVRRVWIHDLPASDE